MYKHENIENKKLNCMMITISIIFQVIFIRNTIEYIKYRKKDQELRG